MNHHADICSCGDAKDHVVARRLTADRKSILLWSDGSLTGGLGHALPGAAFKPRTSAKRSLALRAGWLVIGEVCLHDYDDLARLVKAARWAAERDGLPGTVRARMRALRERETALKPKWEVYATDRDGRPTVRIWRLPALLGYAGLVVWHERGRYEVLRSGGHHGRRDASTLWNTGFSQKNLRDLLALLPTLRTS